MNNRYRHGRTVFPTLGICAAFCILAGGAMAAEYYVTPAGAGDYGGTNWHNAYSNVQTAATLATNVGDAIYLQWGVYSNASQVVISNAAGVTIYGGCNGPGTSSNAYSGTNSTLTRTGGVMRIVYATNSTLNLQGVTISGGSFSSGGTAGSGLYAGNCSLTLSNCMVRDNSISYGGSGFAGGGLYSAGGTVAVFNCQFSNNVLSPAGSSQSGYGGAIYFTGAVLRVVGTMFADNRVDKDNAYGGAIYQSGAEAVLISNCVFQNNGRATGNQAAYGTVCLAGGRTATVTYCTFKTNGLAGGSAASRYGGALYLENWSAVNIVSNYFLDNYLAGVTPRYGSVLYLSGCATTLVDRCVMDSVAQTAGAEYVYINAGASTVILNTEARNGSSRGIVFNGSATSSLHIANSLLYGHQGDGILIAGGTVSITNCLVAKSVLGSGISLSGGTATVVQCTLADNGGWGFQYSGGTGAVLNSIAWGNAAGGFASNASLRVDYSCSQIAPYGGGTSNITDDPLFANAPGYYYLSVNGLTNQPVSSPCINRGSNSAAFWGLTNRTTRTDGSNDTETVDMGYHYTSGIPGGQILPPAPTNCYVDAVNGNNTNSGASWGAAWQTLSMALSNVAFNGTINVATGVYNVTKGETFPLTVQKVNLAIVASNTNPELTALDNGGTAGRRVFSAIGKGAITLAGLTFKGGKYTSVETAGAGLYFQGCASVVLSNCVAQSNTIDYSSSGFAGAGLYYDCSGGALDISSCLFSNNLLSPVGAGQSGYGGALYFTGAVLRVVGTTFANNRVNKDNAYGGAIYQSGANALVISNCVFQNNGRDTGGGNQAAMGMVCLVGGRTATVTHCTFKTNGLAGGSAASRYGGALYLENWSAVNIVSNYFLDNYVAGVTPRYGSVLYLSGCATTLVDRCVMDSVAQTAGAEYVYINAGASTVILNTEARNGSSRGIFFVGAAGATLGLTNCLLTRNAGDGLLISSGTATLVNCTLADNVGWGIARPTSSALTVKNSIFWGNTFGGIGHNHNLALSYTDSQDAWAAGLGTGNISADPLFVDAAGGDYHEQGVEGSWHDGAWAPDARNSPCLDAGDPASDWLLEPKPCGNRINLGAYGNTAEATRSLPKVGTVLRIY